MKRSNAALAALFAGALTCGLGCGDAGSKTGASAEPAKSGAAASTGTAKSSAATAKSSAAPAGASGAPKAEAAAGATADVMKYMPKDCDEGRIFVDLGKLITGDVGSSLDSIIGMAMAQGKGDAKKQEEVMKVLKEGKIDPIKDMKQLAICAAKSKKTVAAIAMDTKAEKPADVFAKAIEAGEGKAPTKEEKDGVTYLKSGKGEGGMAIIGNNLILMADDTAALEAAAKGADGGAAFGDAKSHVVWAKMEDKTKAEIMLKEAGSDYDLKVVANAGPQGAKMKSEFDKMLPELDKLAEKEPMLKPLLPIAKNAKLDVQGDVLTITTKFPQGAIGSFLKEAGKKDPKDLMKGLKF